MEISNINIITKKVRTILCIIIGITATLYIVLLSYTRDFYYINGIPITIYENKIIMGNFYCGFSSPETDYVIFKGYSVGEIIYFFNNTEFDIFTTSVTDMNLKKYACRYVYHIEECSFNDYEETHRIEDAYVRIDMYWDWGHFWPSLYYQAKNGEVKYISHKGFCKWNNGVFNKCEK